MSGLLARLSRLEERVDPKGPARPFERLTDSQLLERTAAAHARATRGGDHIQANRLGHLLADWGVKDLTDLPVVLDRLRTYEADVGDGIAMRIARLRARRDLFESPYPNAPNPSGWKDARMQKHLQGLT